MVINVRRRATLSTLLSGMGALTAGCAGISTLIDPKITNGMFGSLWDNDPLTTQFSDAKNVIVLPDSFAPSHFLPLTKQPGSDGYKIGTGAYRGTFESYCLRIGTRGPGKGTGYLDAPAKGSRAEIITDILKNAGSNKDIRQEDIQVLLWGIIASTKLSAMPQPSQVAATRLLSSAQLLQLQGGALGLLPESTLNSMMARVPPEVQQILRAEQQVRQLFNSATASYKALEAVAVPGIDTAVSNVPRGRWVKHPDGYFIRYFPEGYQRVTVEIYSPRPGSRQGLAPSTFTRTSGTEKLSHNGSIISAVFPFDPTELFLWYRVWSRILVPSNSGAQRLGISGRDIAAAGVTPFKWERHGEDTKLTHFEVEFQVMGTDGIRILFCNYIIEIPAYIPNHVAERVIRNSGVELGREYQEELQRWDPTEDLQAETIARTYKDRLQVTLRLQMPGTQVRSAGTFDLDTRARRRPRR